MTDMANMSVASYVWAGVNLLDAEHPGWESQIDISQLDIESSRVCILGQLYGRYDVGKSRLGITSGTEYGFCYSNPSSYPAEELSAYWRDVIAQRRFAKFSKCNPELVEVK